MSYMLYDCYSLKELPDIYKWKVENLINASYMFYGCSSLFTIPELSKWNPKNIIDVGHMFYVCSSLITIPDISKWNINNIKNKEINLLTNNSSLLFPASFQKNLFASFKSNDNDNNNNKNEKKEYKYFNTFENINDEKLNDYYDNFYN